MKRVMHFLIGASSGALIYITSLTPSTETALLFIGILIGSVLPDIDGNFPKKYHQNPLLLWPAYFNHIILYPVLKFIFRKKDLKKRDLSNFFVIVVLALIFSIILWIINMGLNIQIQSDFFIIGLLMGGIFTTIAHLGTKEGAVPIYPLWKKKIKGNVETRRWHEKRTTLIIIIPLVIIGWEIMSGFSFPVMILPIRDFNFIALIFLWIGYLYSAHVFSFKSVTSSRPRFHSKPRFHSSVEKYIFEELNKERKKHGLRTLKFDNSYADMSRHHSKKMASSGSIFHGNNVTRTHGSYSGENCASMPRGRVQGFPHTIRTDKDVAKALHRSWMNSTGHRENILNPGFNYVGIGINRRGRLHYATQLFSN